MKWMIWTTGGLLAAAWSVALAVAAISHGLLARRATMSAPVG